MYTWDVRCKLNAMDWTQDDVAALAAATTGDAERDSEESPVLLTMRVESMTLGGAADRAQRIVRAALQEIARPARIVGLLVEEADVQGGLVGDLAGAKEAATILGVVRSRVTELAKTAAGFPAPLAVLASGPVWDARAIRAFAATRSRQSGRPRKAA